MSRPISSSSNRGVLALGVTLAVLLACTAGCDPKGSVPDRAEFRPRVTPDLPANAGDYFADVTSRAGITYKNQFCDDRIANIIESNGTGGVWFDFDGDGLVDLYVVNSGPLEGVTHHKPGTAREPNRLYRNLGNGKFADVTSLAGVAGAGYGTSAVAADYDNDGHPDLYVVNVGKSVLYHNKGDGTFEDVTDKAGVANEGGTGIGAVFLDADNDGRLDLFVANYLKFDPNYRGGFHPESPYPGPFAYAAQSNRLYRNRGDGTFEDVSAKSGIEFQGNRAMSVTTFDANDDGFPDLYLSNDGTPNQLLVNNGKGEFSDVGVSAGVAFNAMGEAAGSMAAAVGDCNGDGTQDIFVTRLGYGSLYLGTPKGRFDDAMMESQLGALTRQFVGWGSACFDFDNDGDQDIVVANGDALYLLGSETLLLENDGQGRFSGAGAKGGSFFKTKLCGRAVGTADFNNDGRMDFLVTAIADRLFLMENRIKNTNHWLGLDLEGTRSNRDGFGARVKVVAGQHVYQGQVRCAFGFLMQSDRRLHFGLAGAATIDRVEVKWPSGEIQELKDVKPDQVLKVREPGERPH